LTPRPQGAGHSMKSLKYFLILPGHFTLDEGFLSTSYIKAIESVDSYELDIEAIYRRHSVEEMSVPVMCWTINFGCSLNDNEFLYFLAPQQIAQYWMGLEKVLNYRVCFLASGTAISEKLKVSENLGEPPRPSGQ